MDRYARCAIVCILLFLTPTWADDRIHFNEEDERRWNTPPELTSEPVGRSTPKSGTPEARFLPFSATFSLNAGTNNAHSLSVGGGNDGISLSQSASQKGDNFGVFGNAGPALSASQSSSFSAGLSGISASDANAFNLNHPIFGGTSQANTNSFSIGDANASSHGKAENGHAGTGAQSSIGSVHSSASSGTSSSAGNSQASLGNKVNVFDDRHGHRQSRPIWTNIGPNYEDRIDRRRPGHRGSSRPTLIVSDGPRGWSDYDRRRRPIQLMVDLNEGRWQKREPEIHSIDQWQSRPTNLGQSGWRNRNCENRGDLHNGQFGNYYDSTSGCSNGFSRPAGFQRPGRPGSWSQGHQSQPGLQVSAASASSDSSSSGNGFSIGQSSSYSSNEPNGPSSTTTNHVQTLGTAQGFAQGTSAAVGQTLGGSTDASFSSGAISGSSMGNGGSIGHASSGNRGQNSRGQVHEQTIGSGSVLGTANSGSVSFDRFSEQANQNIPGEFVRSRPILRNEQRGRTGKKDRHPVDTFLTDITDTVADLFDI